MVPLRRWCKKHMHLYRCGRALLFNIFILAANVQYFYSSDGKETLIVDYKAIDKLPVQLSEDAKDEVIEEIENKLPTPTSGNGTFRYYNNFKCPHYN